MPTYNFKNKKTKKEWSEFLSIAEMEELLEKNKNIELMVSAPAIVDPWNASRVKIPSGFNDVLKRIKKGNRRSKITTGNLGQI